MTETASCPMNNKQISKQHDLLTLQLIDKAFRQPRFNAQDCMAIQDLYEKYCTNLDSDKRTRFREGVAQRVVEILLEIEKRD